MGALRPLLRRPVPRRRMLARGDDDDDSGTVTPGDTGQTEAGGRGQMAAAASSRRCRTAARLRCGVNDAVPGLRVHRRGRRAGGLRHRLLQGRRCGGAGRRRGGRVHAALGRAALHGAPVRRDRRPHPQHDVHGLARRHGGRSLPAHDVLRRAGDDGAQRTAARTLEDLDGRDDLRAFRNDDRAQPRVAVPGGGIDYTPLAFEDNEPLQAAFVQERCGAWTSDKSQLAGIRSTWPESQGGPEALTILDETMSKEPLGPGRRRR